MLPLLLRTDTQGVRLRKERNRTLRQVERQRARNVRTQQRMKTLAEIRRQKRIRGNLKASDVARRITEVP